MKQGLHHVVPLNEPLVSATREAVQSSAILKMRALGCREHLISAFLDSLAPGECLAEFVEDGNGKYTWFGALGDSGARIFCTVNQGGIPKYEIESKATSGDDLATAKPESMPTSGGVPSPNTEFLFYLFLDAQTCDALVGDLEERYKLILRKFGPRKANFWYWTQALRSVVPIAWVWMKKVALKPVIGITAWAVAKGFQGHDSWLPSVVEIWKRIRL